VECFSTRSESPGRQAGATEHTAVFPLCDILLCGGKYSGVSFVSLCDMLFCVGGKGRWNASVLAQKAQVGTVVQQW
jgi:hypothetical protein